MRLTKPELSCARAWIVTVATLAVVTGILVRLAPSFPTGPFALVILLAALALICWITPRGPSLFAYLAGFAALVWILPNRSQPDWGALLGYLVVGGALTLFAWGWQSAQTRARREAAETHCRRDELEQEIASHRETRARQEMLAAIVDSAEDGIVSKTLDGIVTSWNSGAERIFGYTAQEMIGQHITTIIPPELRKEEEGILRLLRRGEAVDHFETVRVRKDGTRINVSLRISPVRDSRGQLTGASKVARDITRQKQMEAALRQAQRELLERQKDLEKLVEARTAALSHAVRQLESFAYTVSHDLRAPLRAIKGFTNALQEDYAEAFDVPGREYARRIVESVGRMEELIGALLTYSRVGRGDIPLIRIDLDTYLPQLTQNWKDELNHHADCLEIARPLHPVLGNPVLLEQALTNLVSNALKFTADGVRPRVRLESQQTDGRVFLRVIDNGIGIAPKHRDKLFQVFQRLHTTDQYPGTGIGLAIVQKAAERMGGRVGVESELGKGSCFWIELPMATTEGEPSEVLQPTSTES